MSEPKTRRPLDGVRVLEIGQLVAGPFAGTLLAYYGAEVIRIESPGEGDPIRGWRVVDNGTSLWWRTLGRNKKCITLNLREERGREIARDLAAESDVLIENFRPGVLETWGLAPEDMHPRNPDLIYARVSGYGQTGPYASRPGYASVCEGFGGLRYVTGFPGGPPVRSNLSLADSLTGLHAAFGLVLALFERQRNENAGTGQVIDLAVFESVYNMMEAVVPEFDRCGEVREPSGSTITGVVPTNAYPCEGGGWVIIGANGESNFRRLMKTIGRTDMAENPEFEGNQQRVKHREEIDTAIAEWTSTRAVNDVVEVLEESGVPAGPIFSVREMMSDPHYAARGLFEEVDVDGRPLQLPAIVPKLSATPGRTDWPGPSVGEHNAEILIDRLGISPEELDELRKDGIV